MNNFHVLFLAFLTICFLEYGTLFKIIHNNEITSIHTQNNFKQPRMARNFVSH